MSPSVQVDDCIKYIVWASASGHGILNTNDFKSLQGILLVVMFSGYYMDTWMSVSLSLQENMAKNSGGWYSRLTCCTDLDVFVGKRIILVLHKGGHKQTENNLSSQFSFFKDGTSEPRHAS